MSDITKSRVLSSLFWKFMERWGAQGIQFIVAIILARQLMPEDYGTIALVLIFTAIASVFVESGMNSALIQKKDADEIDFSSVFYLSLSLALIIYIILFFAAPYIASFYKIPQITAVFRVLSITLIFGAFNSIQNAVISRNLQFKKLFFSSTGAILVSGTVGIYMAYAGYGVWALVGQQISSQLMVTLILWFTVKWRPQLLFSFERLKGLFSFGWNLLAVSMLTAIFQNLRSLIIGKMYTPAMLGFYNRGEMFPSLMVSSIDGSLQSVMFPVLASHQDNRPRVKEMMRRTIVTSTFIVFPMMVGLAVIAEPLVKILLTEKWLPAVPFLQIFCASYALFPIHAANLSAIKGLGYGNVYLRLALAKRAVGLTILIISVSYGVYAIALGGVLSGIIASFINASPNKKLLDYSYTEQWRDIYPSLFLSLLMGAVVYNIKWLSLPIILTLLVQIIVGMIFYFGMAWLLKIESFTYLINTISGAFKTREMA